MKSYLKQIFSWMISLSIAVTFLFLAFYNINLNEVFTLFNQIDYKYLLSFFALYFITNIIRAYRWKFIIQSVKDDASIVNLFSAMMIGYGVNSIVPRLGEFYRAFFLAKWENISRGSMFGTVIVERIIDLIFLLLSVFISIYIYNGNIYLDIPWLKTTLIWTGSVIAVLILFLIVLIITGEKSYSVLIQLISKFSKNYANQIESLFKKLIEGFSSIKGKKNLALVIFSSALIMAFYGLTSYAGFYMLGMQNNYDVNLKIAWILMTISAFGVVIPTPGGLGSYHAIVIFVLTALFSFSNEISAAYALLTHAISYFGFILIAFLSLMLVSGIRKRQGLKNYNFWSVLKNESN